MPIVIKAVGCTDARVLEEEVDEDIEKFSAYFQSLGNDPFSKFEKAAIKTYLHWKTHGEPSSTDQATTPEGSDAEEAAG
jgi:hypothetical protein